MDYIAVLDYDHMDNGMFLTSFARSLAKQKKRGIIVHGESEYTERLIQTGIMREEATIRAMKDLNHRLVALFADQGISTIGLNGYQKSLVTSSSNGLDIDTEQLKKLPEHPTLLISSLALNIEFSKPKPIPISQLVQQLQDSLSIADIIIFSAKKDGEIIQHDLPEKISMENSNRDLIEELIPSDLIDSDLSMKLTTAQKFSNFPDADSFSLVTQ